MFARVNFTCYCCLCQSCARCIRTSWTRINKLQIIGLNIHCFVTIAVCPFLIFGGKLITTAMITIVFMCNCFAGMVSEFLMKVMLKGKVNRSHIFSTVIGNLTTTPVNICHINLLFLRFLHLRVRLVILSLLWMLITIVLIA